MAQIISGKELAAQVKRRVAEGVRALAAQGATPSATSASATSIAQT